MPRAGQMNLEFEKNRTPRLSLSLLSNSSPENRILFVPILSYSISLRHLPTIQTHNHVNRPHRSYHSITRWKPPYRISHSKNGDDILKSIQLMAWRWCLKVRVLVQNWDHHMSLLHCRVATLAHSSMSLAPSYQERKDSNWKYIAIYTFANTNTVPFVHGLSHWPIEL